VKDLFEYALQDLGDSDMVGINIQNQVNQNGKSTGISFGRKGQLSGEVMWSIFEKVSQSNSRFNALDTLVVTVHWVKMSVGIVYGIKTKGRPLSVMAHHKINIVEVKATESGLAHALIIGITRLEKDSNYDSYRRGWKIHPVVRDLIATTGIDLASGGVIP